MRDQCRGKRGGNLWQRERPDRELFIPAVAKRATTPQAAIHLPRSRAPMMLANEQEVVENPVDKADRVDQESGNDKEDRNEQRFGQNSSLTLAGACCAEALMASPARNAPTMPGSWIASASTPAMAMMLSISTK